MNYPLPTVHLNGTGREMLSSGYTAAFKALRGLEEAMYDIEFNARDYYVQGPEAFSQAQAERRRHLKALKELHEYLMEHRAGLMAD